MKKAITFALVAFAVTTLQAATITWKSGTVTSSDGVQANNSGNIVNGFVFLVTEAEWNAFDVNSADAVQEYVKDGAAVKTASATGSSTKKGAIDMGTDATAAAGMQYALIFYVDKNNMAKVTKGRDFINDLGAAEGVASTGLASNSYASSGFVSTSVPEPTTLALLALGLAAVGLKRKVA